LDFFISNEDCNNENIQSVKLIVGSKAIMSYKYIGGEEGKSEHWWIRVEEDGKRVQLSEPLCTCDSIYHVVTADDIGSTLKAKCRPIRSDGTVGEIFTSKSSEICV